MKSAKTLRRPPCTATVLFLLAASGRNAGAQTPDAAKVVEMCKRDGKNIADEADRLRAKNSAWVENDYEGEERRLRTFEKTCIASPGADAIKSAPGYGDVLTLHQNAKNALALLHQLVEAKEGAKKAEAERRRQEYEMKKAEEQRKASAEAAAEKKRQDDKRAAEEARIAADERVRVAKFATETCTQKGQLSQPCFEFFTTIENDHNNKLEDKHVIRNCFFDATNASRGESSAAALLKSGSQSKFALECMRMTDASRGTEWRTREEKFQKNMAFRASLEEAVRADFKSKCGVRAVYETGHIVFEKKSASNAVFLSRKSPEGDVVTIFCSGDVATRYASGGSSRSSPKSAAQVTAEENLNDCAMAKAKRLIACPNGSVSYVRSEGNCRKAAEALCKAER